MAVNSAIYANSTAVIKSLKLLNHEKLMRMVDAKSADDALKVLYEVSFGDGFEVQSSTDFEKLIQAEERSLVNFIDEYTPKKKVTDVFKLTYDYHNLKAVFKAKYSGFKDIESVTFPFAAIPVEELKEAVYADNYSILSEFAVAAAQSIDNLKLSENLSSGKIDVICDKAMFEEIFAALKNSGEETLKEYYVTMVDLKNIGIFSRCKKYGLTLKAMTDMLIAGGTIGNEIYVKAFDLSLEALTDALKYTKYKDYSKLVADCVNGEAESFKAELAADNILTEIFKAKRFEDSGINQFLSYIIAKKTEIKNVRIILVSKNNKFDRQKTVERLRETYE